MDDRIVAGLAEGLGAAAQQRGITIDWRHVDDVDAQVVTAVASGELPDIAMVSAPRVVQALVTAGAAKSLDSVVDAPSLKSAMVPGAVEAGTIDGRMYGLMTSINLQGLVFYAKKPFDAAGLKEPTTLDELQGTVDGLKANYQPAWCNGIESGDLTGWPATDLIENLVLRLSGRELYTQWLDGSVAFASPEVSAAFETYGDMYFPEGMTFGGREAIANTSFTSAGVPMFDARPGCILLQQGSFMTRYFPKYVQDSIDSQVGVFPMPGSSPGPQPQVGGGQLSVLLSDNPNASWLIQQLARDRSIGIPAAATGSYISPFKDFGLEHYTSSDLAREMAQIAYETTFFTFDSGDVVNDPSGPAAFRDQTTAWISGGQPLDAALAAIDSSWS